MKFRRLQPDRSGSRSHRTGRKLPHRTGTTLTEVLIAILIMGIGIVMIATLFPSSVLQSIAATKLTNATLLRLNAEAAIDTSPDQLIHNPDGDNDFVEHHGENYVVDPQGFLFVTGSANRFGNGGANWLPRYDGRAAAATPVTQTQADALTTLPDSWREQISAIVGSFTATSVTLTSSTDQSDLAQLTKPNPSPPGPPVPDGPTRVTLLDSTGRISHVRAVTSISGLTINWTGNLPGGFTPVDVRVETRDLNYSWMLTVRNRGSGTGTGPNLNRNANVDVVVFFRRTFVLDEERVYRMVGGGGLKYTLNLASGGPRPILKKGGFLCDAQFGRWYRIVQLDGENSNSVTVYIDREPPASEIPNNVIFMPGVVEVYPLRIKDKGANP